MLYGPNDEVVIAVAGVTLHRCLAAAEELAQAGIPPLYSIKPLDRVALLDTCRAVNNRLVVVEDHHPEGGIGGAVMEALADADVGELHIKFLGVNGLPMSGQPAELLDAAGSLPTISAQRPATWWTPRRRVDPTNTRKSTNGTTRFAHRGVDEACSFKRRKGTASAAGAWARSSPRT